MNPDKIGDKYELEIVLPELLKYNPNAKRNGCDRNTMTFEEKFKWYDFEDFGGIEVKGDEWADKTNKFAFDKHTNGEESGLLTTRAYWHILFSETRFWIIKTDTLKFLCNYKDGFRYFNTIANKPVYAVVLHDERFYNKYSGNIMDFYRIPLPAIELFAIDGGRIEDFNLNSLL